MVDRERIGKEAKPDTVISTAALIVLILNPLQLFSAGFALSFSAVAGITLLYSRFMRGFDRVCPPLIAKRKQYIRRLIRSIVRKFKQILAVSLSAQFGVLLPIAAYFHHFYPYSIVFNLLIVPIVGILVPLFAVTTLTIWIPWVGGYLGAALGGAAELAAMLCCGWYGCRFIAIGGNPHGTAKRMGVSRRFRQCCNGIAFRTRIHSQPVDCGDRCCGFGFVLTNPPSLRYHQLAVGWADSALIVDGGTTIGIDTGSTGSEMGNRLLAEAARSGCAHPHASAFRPCGWCGSAAGRRYPHRAGVHSGGLRAAWLQ